MTKFDPRLALEILERRHRRLENEGVQKSVKIYSLIWSGHKLPWSEERAIENERDALYKQADDMWKPMEYLRQRIEDEKTDAERIWDVLQHRDFPDIHGEWLVSVVEDVLDVARALDINLTSPYADSNSTNEGEAE